MVKAPGRTGRDDIGLFCRGTDGWRQAPVVRNLGHDTSSGGSIPSPRTKMLLNLASRGIRII